MARSQTKARASTSRRIGTMEGNGAFETAAGMQEGMVAGSRQFAVLGEHAFDAWMRSSNETLQRVLTFNVELASFGREQLDDAITAVRSLAQCRSLGDAYGIQLGLMRSTMENSMRHADRVMNLTAHLMSAGVRAAQPRA